MLIKQKLLHRLKITRGHLDKVINMLEEDEYCVDIIHQSIAVQAALRKIDKLVLENHMNTCVANQIKKGKKEKVIKEVMSVMDKMT